MNTTWSEFEHMIWCFDCEKDTPGSRGIFDGPIPLECCNLMGVRFDRINIKTGKIMKQERWRSINHPKKRTTR